MTVYLIDVFTEKNEVLLSHLIREAQEENEDELNRKEWQLDRADYDVNLSDLVAVAVYTKGMESLSKYIDGIAYYEGEELVDKIEQLLYIAQQSRDTFAGWGVKTYVVPVITRAFILAGKDISIIDDVFNTYPFENYKTADLDNMYNFNGQMSTVRARNRYSLYETALAYGIIDELPILEGVELHPERTLRDRIALQRDLFELRGLKWT